MFAWRCYEKPSEVQSYARNYILGGDENKENQEESNNVGRVYKLPIYYDQRLYSIGYTQQWQGTLDHKCIYLKFSTMKYSDPVIFRQELLNLVCRPPRTSSFVFASWASTNKRLPGLWMIEKRLVLEIDWETDATG